MRRGALSQLLLADNVAKVEKSNDAEHLAKIDLVDSATAILRGTDTKLHAA